MRSSRRSQAGIGQSSEEGLNTGHHEKAPDRCPCSRMATLQGATWMQLLASSPPASAKFLSPSSALSPPLVNLDIDENNWDGLGGAGMEVVVNMLDKVRWD